MTWVERETGVPPLVLEGVIDGGTTGSGATDPLLKHEWPNPTSRQRFLRRTSY